MKRYTVLHAMLAKEASNSCGTQAFQGATGLFLLTDFYGCNCNPELELQHGKDAVDAAKEVSAPEAFNASTSCLLTCMLL